jgi:hypothetical protein
VPATVQRRGLPWALVWARRAPPTGASTHSSCRSSVRWARRSSRRPTVTVARGTSTVVTYWGAVPPARPRPWRWPIVTSSTASTLPTARPWPSTTVPGWVASRGWRNDRRPPVAVMKQTSWLSGLSAVARPSLAATARTSALVRWPTGKRTRARAGSRSMWTTYDWSLVASAPRATRRVPARCSTIRAWWPVATASNPRASARRSRRSNFRWRLHSMHGLGVRPAAWSATYGDTTCSSKSSPKRNVWCSMPRRRATARASSTSATEQQPESDSPPQSFNVAPTT